MNLEHCQHLFDGAPSRVQIAFDGAWEKAVRFDPGRSSEISKEFLAALKQPSNNVALEVFFGPEQNAMLGFRHSSKLNVSTQDFVLEITRIAMANSSFLECFDALKTLCEPWGFQPFAQEPQRAELGVLDFWNSMGALELWRAPAPRFIPLKMQGDSKPHLVKNSKNQIMLEFAFPGNAEHWMGFVVSNLEQGLYRLDGLMLDTVLYAFDFEFEPDPEYEHKWQTEIERRIEDLRADPSKGIPFEEVMRRLELLRLKTQNTPSTTKENS